MKSLIFMLMLVGGLPAIVDAAPRRRVVQQESALTVVPFAVPVATPVAVVNSTGVFYAYSPLAATYGANDRDDAQWREFEEFRRWKESRQPVSSSVTPTISSLCLKCHTGAAAKSDFRLDVPLTADARLRAIRAVLAGRMPKDKPLSAMEIGRLVSELAAEP